MKDYFKLLEKNSKKIDEKYFADDNKGKTALEKITNNKAQLLINIDWQFHSLLNEMVEAQYELIEYLAEEKFNDGFNIGLSLAKDIYKPDSKT